MKKSIFAVRRLTLNDIINSEEFQAYQAESIVRYLTHREIIQGWRNFVINLRLDLEIPSRVYKSIQREIDACQFRHEAAGTLNQQIW